MAKIKVTLLLLFSGSINLLNANPHSDEVYNSIKNICNPTYAEYLLIENYLSNGVIPHIEKMVDWKNRPLKRAIKLVDGSLDSIKHSIIYVRNKKMEKENCIILYASFDGNQSINIDTLVSEIQKSNYEGDIIKRLGGWPNIEEGDLRFAHIPGAHKVCAFKEALRLGYKRALWIDSNFLPEISLKTLFDQIEESGLFCYKTQFSLLDLCRRGEYISSFNISKQAAKEVSIIHTGILGIDLERANNQALLSKWGEVTIAHEISSFTPFSVHSLFSFLLHDYYPTENFPFFIDHIDPKESKNLEFTRQ